MAGDTPPTPTDNDAKAEANIKRWFHDVLNEREETARKKAEEEETKRKEEEAKRPKPFSFMNSLFGDSFKD